jgi:hypothetical protein
VVAAAAIVTAGATTAVRHFVVDEHAAAWDACNRQITKHLGAAPESDSVSTDWDMPDGKTWTAVSEFSLSNRGPRHYAICSTVEDRVVQLKLGKLP